MEFIDRLAEVYRNGRERVRLEKLALIHAHTAVISPNLFSGGEFSKSVSRLLSEYALEECEKVRLEARGVPRPTSFLERIFYSLGYGFKKR